MRAHLFAERDTPSGYACHPSGRGEWFLYWKKIFKGNRRNKCAKFPFYKGVPSLNGEAGYPYCATKFEECRGRPECLLLCNECSPFHNIAKLFPGTNLFFLHLEKLISRTDSLFLHLEKLISRTDSRFLHLEKPIPRADLPFLHLEKPISRANSRFLHLEKPFQSKKIAKIHPFYPKTKENTYEN
jgi:hypothetical protein